MRYWRLYWLYATILVACAIGIVQHFTRTYGEARDERFSQLERAARHLDHDHEEPVSSASPALAEPCDSMPILVPDPEDPTKLILSTDYKPVCSMIRMRTRQRLLGFAAGSYGVSVGKASDERP